ncbi:MAG: hypothetical protein GQ565_13760 [Candidatus Aegiribacteria sp.]|nr:hypothetical protein [Candidatus Aegiribacteria sp.]
MNKCLNIPYAPFWYPPHEDQPAQKGTFARERRRILHAPKHHCSLRSNLCAITAKL